jgi:hypothetical protein
VRDEQREHTVWISPNHVWQISCPKGWSEPPEKRGTFNIATPDGGGAITISCYDRPSGDAEALYQLIPKLVANWREISSETVGPSGYSGEFVDSTVSPPRRLLVRAKHTKNHFVLLTANDAESRFEQYRSQYEKIMGSFSWI